MNEEYKKLLEQGVKCSMEFYRKFEKVWKKIEEEQMNNEREIKFRGKRKDSGEWVYGSLLITHDNKYFIWNGKYFDDWVDDVVEVIPETVGQLIGIKNGKEIYEGDIVNASWRDDYGGETVRNAVVRFNTEQSGFSPFANSPFDNRIYEYIEVIGNIHDNPKLLEKD